MIMRESPIKTKHTLKPDKGINLVLDLGNTRFKAGFFLHEELIDKVVYDAGNYNALLDFIGKRIINVCILSSVVQIPDYLEDSLKKRSQRYFELDATIQYPITINYQSAETLGKDRLALASGAALKYPKSHVLVVSAGTCITYDFISKEGVYPGGSISPGMNMRFKALARFTDRLPLLEVNESYEKLTGQTTSESIHSGIQLGMIEEINGIIKRYRHKYPSIKIILCGGDTNYLLKKLKNITFADENFILYCLNQLILFNDK